LVRSVGLHTRYTYREPGLNINILCVCIYIYSHFVGPFVCESIFSLQNQSFLGWNWIPYVPKSPLHVFLLCEHQGFKYRYGVQNRSPPISSKITKIGSNSNFKMWGIFLNRSKISVYRSIYEKPSGPLLGLIVMSH
jgi:hypothetical protein